MIEKLQKLPVAYAQSAKPNSIPKYGAMIETDKSILISDELKAHDAKISKFSDEINEITLQSKTLESQIAEMQCEHDKLLRLNQIEEYIPERNAQIQALKKRISIAQAKISESMNYAVPTKRQGIAILEKERADLELKCISNTAEARREEAEKKFHIICDKAEELFQGLNEFLPPAKSYRTHVGEIVRRSGDRRFSQYYPLLNNVAALQKYIKAALIDLGKNVGIK